mgnify:CR=1 FL=1
MPNILFLSSEHWGIISDGLIESECHKTTFSSIEIAISKIPNRSYFSGANEGTVDIDFISEVENEQWVLKKLYVGCQECVIVDNEILTNILK